MFTSKRKTNRCKGKDRLHKRTKQIVLTRKTGCINKRSKSHQREKLFATKRKIVRNKEKGRLHHCDPPLIRELFKKSSYYQYLYLYKYRINFILSFHLILFIILFFRCCECITHQRTDGHWTNTTRNGRNKRAFGSDFFELHITIKAKSVLLS